MSWTLEIGQGEIRGYVSPMDGRGAPYRLTVTRPGGTASLFVGLPSVASAVESFCTASAGSGQPVPIGARAEWEAHAEALDGMAI